MPSRPARRGNPASRQLIADDVFEVCDRKWRGVGLIEQSGYRLRDEYRDHDADSLFDVEGDRDARVVRSASAARS